MRKFLKLFAASAILSVAGLLPVSDAAHADNGDNGPGCASGEICFWYNSGNTYQKQFWNNADHGNHNFMYYDGYRYEVSSEPLQDNALEATNRDTQCRVAVGNLSGGFWTWRVLDRDGVRYHLGAVNNRNDRHQRCNW